MAFLILGVSMLSVPEQFVGSLWNSLNLIRLLGGLSLVFFWVTMFICVRRLTDHTPGLTLDPQGFTAHKAIVRDIERFAGAGISWQNIAAIQEIHLGGKRFVEIEFKDQRAQNSLTEAGSSDALETLSSLPILLSSRNLSIDSNDLLAQFNKYHQAYHSKSR